MGTIWQPREPVAQEDSLPQQCQAVPGKYIQLVKSKPAACRHKLQVNTVPQEASVTLEKAGVCI